MWGVAPGSKEGRAVCGSSVRAGKGGRRWAQVRSVAGVAVGEVVWQEAGKAQATVVCVCVCMCVVGGRAGVGVWCAGIEAQGEER